MEEIQMTFREKLAVAEAYAMEVDTALEIDVRKKNVSMIDHITGEWLPVEEIFEKYFEKAGVD